MEHRNDLQSHAFSGLGKDLWQNTEFYLNEQVDKNPERYPHFSGKLPRYEKGLCPVWESIQPEIMMLKTNYFDSMEVEMQAEILAKTILYFSV